MHKEYRVYDKINNKILTIDNDSDDWDELKQDEEFGFFHCIGLYRFTNLINDENYNVMEKIPYRDKNGKYIYENDLLEDSHGNILQVKKGEFSEYISSIDTYIDNYGFFLENIKTKNQEGITFSYYYEIIGNIFTSPQQTARPWIK